MTEDKLKQALDARRHVALLRDAIESWEKMPEPTFIGSESSNFGDYRLAVTTRAVWVKYRQDSLSALHEAMREAQKKFDAA